MKREVSRHYHAVDERPYNISLRVIRHFISSGTAALKVAKRH